MVAVATLLVISVNAAVTKHSTSTSSHSGNFSNPSIASPIAADRPDVWGWKMMVLVFCKNNYCATADTNYHSLTQHRAVSLFPMFPTGSQCYSVWTSLPPLFQARKLALSFQWPRRQLLRDHISKHIKQCQGENVPYQLTVPCRRPPERSLHQAEEPHSRPCYGAQSSSLTVLELELPLWGLWPRKSFILLITLLTVPHNVSPMT